LVTYRVDGPAGQIVTLDTIIRGRGFGGRLLEAIESKFHNRGLGRSWALMTNDNLRAAGLYLSRGYRLIRIHLDAIDRVREHKPHLPERGYDGIPIRDLWEFEKLGPLGVPVP
jgi:GNAT superfamily N-acetyltransferase